MLRSLVPQGEQRCPTRCAHNRSRRAPMSISTSSGCGVLSNSSPTSARSRSTTSRSRSADLSAVIASTPKAAHFKRVGAGAVRDDRGGLRQPQAARRGARRAGARDRARVHAPDGQSAAGARGAVGAGAGASGGPRGRRHRPHPAAVPRPARIRRRHLHLRRASTSPSIR